MRDRTGKKIKVNDYVLHTLVRGRSSATGNYGVVYRVSDSTIGYRDIKGYKHIAKKTGGLLIVDNEGRPPAEFVPNFGETFKGEI